MGTQRIDPSSIISSGFQANTTTRSQGGIISSSIPEIQIREGSVISLNGFEYTILKLINSSGESEVFLVEGGGKKLALKYYFSNYKPKEEVIRKLKNLQRRDVIIPLDQGTHLERFWELNEYMLGGTLETIIPVRDLNVLKRLVKQIAEVINACHQNGIIHRDIKPANIFFRNEQKDDIVLGDFGIASNLQQGENYRMTTIARTSTYAAPEMFTNINNRTTLDIKVDFYAFGISLLEGWLGEDPFKQIPEFNIMRIKSEGRVFIPKDMNEDVQNLIKGLITTEPPKRWGYDEIQKWLKGEPVKVSYRTQDVQYSSYEFDRLQGIHTSDPKELAYYMEKDHVKAARQLYSKSIVNWIQTASADMYSELLHLVEFDYPNTTPENTSAGITKAIYILDKDRAYRPFDGSECYSPVDLGNHIEQHVNHYQQELKQKAGKIYLFLEARGFQDRADKYRKYFKEHTPKKALNLTILDLQENKFLISGKTYENVQQLMTTADNNILQAVLAQVQDRDSKLSLWLDISYPTLSKDIEQWRNNKNFISVRTLHYALNTGGFRIQDSEVFTGSEFKNLFKEKLPEFTTAPGAETNRNEAAYWLQKYKGNSFPSIVEYFLINESTTYQEFRVLYEYMLNQTDMEVFSLVTKLTPRIKQVAGNNATFLQGLTKITQKAFILHLTNKRGLKVYALENLKEMLLKLQNVQAVYPAFSDALVISMQTKINNDIHDDLSRLSQNSDSFFKYIEELHDIVMDILIPLKEDASYCNHWHLEQELIVKKAALIENQNVQEKEKDMQLIEQKFAKYIKDQIALNINFLGKGKSFYGIFLWVLAIAMAYNLIVIQYWKFELISALAAFSWSIVGCMIAFFLSRHILNRKENTGLGVIFDPFYKWLGKVLYKPILKRAMKDPNYPPLKSSHEQKQNEVQKAIDRSEGKYADQIFEESVRILFLNDEQLKAELSR